MFWVFNNKKKNRDIDPLARRLEQKREEYLDQLKDKHKELVDWADEKGISPEELVQKGARGMAAGVAAGAVILSSGLSQVGGLEPARNNQSEINVESSVKARKDISGTIKKLLGRVGFADERKLTRELSKTLKMDVKEELNGIKLNTNYGVIGYESHLSRYPGDNIGSHLETSEGKINFGHASMAGGPGAWGYLAPSQKALKARDIEREKYYLVVQTFLSPNWGSPQVKNWFRHRKMVVVNPENGAVVVGAIEDAGPEPSTGSNFGGSPEVMEALGFSSGGRHVLMYFIDDPKDQIPLGPYGI